MTELEKQLLNALELLQQEQEKQQNDSMDLYKKLLKKYEENQAENKQLKASVTNLTTQVERLMTLLQGYRK